MEKSFSRRKRIPRWSIAVVALITLLLSTVSPMAQEEASNQIQQFERYNPTYTEAVEKGTQRDALNLPEYLRAVAEIPKDMDISTFTQAKPEVDMSDGYKHYDYYNYGYIAPEEKTTKDSTEPAVYQLLYDDQNGGIREVAYRIYGSVDGSENMWFACEADGQITGVILNIPVVWSGEYKPDTPGDYTFTAQYSDYMYSGETPTAVITVKEIQDGSDGHNHDEHAEVPPEGEQTTQELDEVTENPPAPKTLEDCHCGPDGTSIDADNFPWAHQEDCIYFSPVECMCREQIEKEVVVADEGGSSHIEKITVPGEFTHIHDENNKNCPLYWQAKAEAAGDKSGTRAIRSTNGGGQNDVAQDEFMRLNTPTGNNPAYTSAYTNGIVIPGAWVDYVNTIWMNKAFSEFAWADASEMTGLHNGWAWGGGVAFSGYSKPDASPTGIPIRINGNWDVYSGEQLLYALNNFITRDTITLQADINLNGSEWSWQAVNCRNLNLNINGNGHKIYNFGQLVEESGRDSFVSAFVVNYRQLMIENLDFVSAKMVSNQECVGIFRGNSTLQTQTAHFENVHIYDSMFYSSAGRPAFQQEDGRGRVSPFGFIENPGFSSTMFTNVIMTNCSTEGNYIYGRDHVAAFALGLGNENPDYSQNSRVENSFAADNLVCGTGGHSAGFSPCFGYRTVMKDCFATNEVYGSAMTSGFVGFLAKSFTNCYSSGKVEGYSRMAGFAWDAEDNSRTFTNCYSTALVGMRTKPTEQGGFIVGETASQGSVNTLTNCYAAGEVGNFDIDLDNPKTVGGFYSTTAASSNYTLKNCYFDKQTTAMREWLAGDSKNRPGVTGVLTSTSKKGGIGLASGKSGIVSEPGVLTGGFRGFTQPGDWKYVEGYYPQLQSFYYADPSVWGTVERANRVQAYSLASTSTISLDTWDEGYDWNADGVRSAKKVFYARLPGAEDHQGNQYTYDTVREIITDVALKGQTTWEHMIQGGAPVDTDGDGSPDGTAMELVNGTLHIKGPGMDWFKLSDTVGGQTGYRTIRLISYMALDAGGDKEIEAGNRYDHREDVSLTMMDKITENLVVGPHNSEIWSTSKTGGYPDSKRFWAVPTTNMETSFSASRDAWLYTEIWRAEQNADGSFVQDNDEGIGSEHLVADRSVKVTGPGTADGTTISEQKWNGEFPFNEDISKPRKYMITYYWMLADGRYRTDTKTITVNPSKYSVGVQVQNDTDKTENHTTLQLGAALDNLNDTAYSYSTTALQEAKIQDVSFTSNAAVAWKKAADTAVIKGGKLTMTAHDGTVMGTKEFSGDLKDGDEITIPITYYYNKYEYSEQQPNDRELTEKEIVDITYMVHKDAEQGYYLRFNKIKNLPSDEVAGAGIGDTTGIPQGVKAYINDVQYNIDLTLYVKEGMPFEFIKTDERGNPLSGVEFEIYPCKEGHTSSDQHSTIADSNSCWDIENPKYTVTSDTDGKVFFDLLTTGDYMLAETKTKTGYQLPRGQWLLQVDTAAEDIHISARGETPPAFKLEDDGSLSLANYPQINLPFAGGFGVLLFTIGGIVLIGTAIILIIVFRKKKP